MWSPGGLSTLLRDLENQGGGSAPRPVLTVMPRATAAARLRQELARRRMVKPVTPTRTNPRTGQPERVAGVDNTLQTQAEQIAAGLLDPQTAARFQIRSIPTMLIFKNGELAERLVGAQPKHAIAARLAAHT